MRHMRTPLSSRHDRGSSAHRAEVVVRNFFGRGSRSVRHDACPWREWLAGGSRRMKNHRGPCSVRVERHHGVATLLLRMRGRWPHSRHQRARMNVPPPTSAELTACSPEVIGSDDGIQVPASERNAQPNPWCFAYEPKPGRRRSSQPASNNVTCSPPERTSGHSMILLYAIRAIG